MVVEWVRGRGGVRVVRLEEGLLASLDVGTGGRKSNKLESNSRSDGSVAADGKPARPRTPWPSSPSSS